MDNAVGLFFSTPIFYFSTILTPLYGGILSVAPAIGIVCLTIGAVWGLIKRRRGLLIFLLLPIVGQVLLVAASIIRVPLHDEASFPILLAFLFLQIAVAGYLIFRLKGARLPATLLTVFTLSYALFEVAVVSF